MRGVGIEALGRRRGDTALSVPRRRRGAQRVGLGGRQRRHRWRFLGVNVSTTSILHYIITRRTYIYFHIPASPPQ